MTGPLSSIDTGRPASLTVLIDRIRRRDRLFRLVTAIITAIAVGLAVATLLVLSRPTDPAQGYGAVLLAATGAFTTATIALLRTAPSSLQLAQRFDRALGTQERLTTVYELEASGAAFNILARLLHAEVLTPDLGVSAGKVRTGSEPVLMGALGGLVLALGLHAATVLWAAHPASAVPASGGAETAEVRAPSATDIATLAETVSQAAQDGNDAALVDSARALEQLASDMARDGWTDDDRATLSGLLDRVRESYGGTTPPWHAPQAPEAASAMHAIAEWDRANPASPASDMAPNAPRTAVQPLVPPDHIATGEDDPDVSRPDTVRPDAAMPADGLQIDPDALVHQTQDAGNEGTSDMIPPALVEGAPRTGQAVDLAGSGEAEHQESLTAQTGGTGSFAADPSPPEPAANNSDTLDLYSTTPNAGRRIHYYLEPDAGSEAPASVTAGMLPNWAPIEAAPTFRQSLGLRGSEVVARFFDRAETAP